MIVSLPDTVETRQSIIDACLLMQSTGINQGTSGNISVRAGDQMLITPSAVPYDQMKPRMICSVPITGLPDPVAGLKPSTEWRFHQSVLQNRPDCAVVVHAHPTYATAVATQRRSIPAIHYMVALFGGHDVPVTGYARYGGDALADMVAQALQERHGCLLANHGAVVVGNTLDQALWRMAELENLAKVFTTATASGEPKLLTEEEIADVLAAFADYRPQA